MKYKFASIVLLVFILLHNSNTLFAQTDWVWARTGSEQYSIASATDKAGNTYIVGSYTSPIVFGTDTLKLPTLTYYPQNMFLVKYAPNGNVLWAKAPGFTDINDFFQIGPQSIAIDGADNIYIIGGFRCDEVFFAHDTLGTATHPCIFYVKYDSSGNEIWAGSGYTNHLFGNCSVATDSFGNVFFGATFLENMSIATYGFGSPDDTSSTFVVKLDTSGLPKWGKVLNRISQTKLTTDPLGNVILTGNYTYPITIGTYTLTNTGINNFYVAKLDSSGNVTWAHSIDGNNSDYATNLATDLNNNIFVCGNYTSNTLSFGSVSLTKTVADTTDIFLVKYNPDGVALWATTAIGTGIDYATAVTINRFGDVYLAGNYTSTTLTFDAGAVTNILPISMEFPKSMFLAKYNEGGINQWAIGTSCVAGIHATDVHTDYSGNLYLSGTYNGDTVRFRTCIDAAPSLSNNFFLAKFSDPSLTQ